jgi:hypothetical protein
MIRMNLRKWIAGKFSGAGCAFYRACSAAKQHGRLMKKARNFFIPAARIIVPINIPIRNSEELFLFALRICD